MCIRDRGDTLRTFSHVLDTAEYVNSITREGDLVLLKGANKQDHLLRIILSRSEEISCWRDDCERMDFCNECPHRSKPSGLPGLPSSAIVADTTAQAPPSLSLIHIFRTGITATAWARLR